MSNSIIIIPSRLAATRLPQKPLIKINNKTLIMHVYEKAVRSQIGDVYVATCDEEIASEVKKNGGKFIMTDINHTTGTDRVFEASQKLDLKDIKINGRKALLKYEKKFSQNTEIVPSKDKINKAINTLEPKIKKSIDLAYNRIFKFHSLQKPKNIKYVDNFKNKLEYKHVPLQSVGIYVPANLPSTLLMNAVPAKISGV